MVGRTKPMNKADKERMEVMQEICCIPCMIQGWPGVRATTQHCTSCGRRYEDEHQVTYRSCEWHHLGYPPHGCKGKVSRATKQYGPSLAHEKLAFALHYGAELQLVQIQDALIRIILSARRRGAYLPETEQAKVVQELHSEIVLGVSPTA